MDVLLERVFADHLRRCYDGFELDSKELVMIELAFFAGMFEVNRLMLHNDELLAALVARMDALESRTEEEFNDG